MGIDVADAVLLLKHIDSIDLIIGNAILAADVNEDDGENMKDLASLLKYTANIDAIDAFNIVDEFSNQITSINMLNTDRYWELSANGDINSSGGFI